MGGRPRALDDVKRREVCALISTGCGLEGAARYVGCNPVTIRREAQRNREFYEELRKAELAAQVVPLHAMRKAVGTHWRAAAWLLERTQPGTFGLRRPQHISVDEVDDAMQILLEVIKEEVTDPEVLLRLGGRITAISDHFEAQSHAVESPRRDVHGRRERQRQLRMRAAAGPSEYFRSCQESNPNGDVESKSGPLGSPSREEGEST